MPILTLPTRRPNAMIIRVSEDDDDGLPKSGEERLGEIVGNRYQLRSLLGHGGQSIIYRAKDLVDGDEVAVKIVRADDRDSVDRLFREARALLALGGTAALRVLHQASTQYGAPCLVTELLRGVDLSEHLAGIEKNGGRMSMNEIIETFDPIVKTLEAARERGIVHRDIKPENIFIIHAAYGGGVRLLDFGFTRFVDGRPFTQQGIVVGSPSYLAPEAWARGASELDHRADVYALGVCLYRVLAGDVPFQGRLQDLLRLVRHAKRPSLHQKRPDLPPLIDDWVEHALAIEPEERFQTVNGMWRALVTCLGRSSVLPPGPVDNSVSDSLVSSEEPVGDGTTTAIMEPVPLRGAAPVPAEEEPAPRTVRLSHPTKN